MLLMFQIKRVQNQALYIQYKAEKESMIKRHSQKKRTFTMEWDMWHGTTKDKADYIAMNHFDRGYAGATHGKLRHLRWYIPVKETVQYQYKALVLWMFLQSSKYNWFYKSNLHLF